MQDQDASATAGTDTGEKERRTHRQRAGAHLRAARRTQREVSEPDEQVRFLLAEANTLALLDLADALGGGSGEIEE